MSNDKHECLNCGHDLTTAQPFTDSLGTGKTCPECGATSNVSNDSKHTPIPWRASKNTFRDNTFIHGEDASLICIVETARANAALIVRAVNLFDEMKEVILFFEKFDHVQTHSEEWFDLADQHHEMIQAITEKLKATK